MSDYTGIINFRKNLRRNCRTEALRGILSNNPVLYSNVGTLEHKHECTNLGKEEIPEDLERLVRHLLTAAKPQRAECLLIPTTKLCQLGEEDFWICLYDELLKYVLLRPSFESGYEDTSGLNKSSGNGRKSLGNAFIE
jgi:hypothetical protein